MLQDIVRGIKVDQLVSFLVLVPVEPTKLTTLKHGNSGGTGVISAFIRRTSQKPKLRGFFFFFVERHASTSSSPVVITFEVVDFLFLVSTQHLSPSRD